MAATATKRSAKRGATRRPPKARAQTKENKAKRIYAKAAKEPAKDKAPKSAPMSFRMDAQTRDLVDRAANLIGQNRTEFMLTVLREKAIEVLLNRRLFLLSDADWDAFVERLDDPPPPNAKLKALLAREPVWDD